MPNSIVYTLCDCMRFVRALTSCSSSGSLSPAVSEQAPGLPHWTGRFGGGDEGGAIGDGDGDGGEGGWKSTTKDSAPLSPLAKEKACPKPGAAHSAPFQPSPYESVISRMQVAPSATASGTVEVYGAPPLSVVPSEQLRLQPTSHGQPPPEQVITEKAACVPVAFGPQERHLGGDGGGGMHTICTA